MLKKNFFIFKKSKSAKFFLYIFISLLIVLFTYLFIPKFYNYSDLKIEKILTNSGIVLKDSNKIDYHIFPSPRLSIKNAKIGFDNELINISSSEVLLVLNLKDILKKENFKFKKLIIKSGFSKLNLDNIDDLVKIISKNNKQIFLKKNNILITQGEKDLFELKNIEGRYIITNNLNKLSINGTFLDYSFLFSFEQNQTNKSSLSLKIPSLNLSSNLFYKKDDISNKKDGTLNFQILDNLIFFKFLEEKEILIEEGYIRNDLFNSSLQGSLSFNPNFTFKLNLDLNYLRFIKFFEFLNKHLFSDNSESLEFFKKVNGTLAISKMPDSLIVFENNDIRFSNITLDKEKNIFINGKISEYGSKGKIQFDITKESEESKKIVISGVILPYASKIRINEIYKENKNYSKEEIESYETKINNEILKKNLNNIFDVNVIDNLINELD